MKPKEFKKADHYQDAAQVEGKPKEIIHYTKDDHGVRVSLWTCPFWERFKFLFHGNIWIGILHPNTLPPIWVDCKKEVKIDKNKKPSTLS